MSEYILAYDIITSGLKAGLYSADGGTVAEYTNPLGMKFCGRHAQQSAYDWYRALIAATAQVVQGVDVKRIACLSFTDQVQVCLMVDGQGEPLHDAITWSDTRSAEIPDPLADMGQARYMELTGQRNTPNSSIRKLYWCKNLRPELYGQAHKMLGCKDYLAFKLTGEFATDYSDASSTGAFDIRSMSWSEEILKRLDIHAELMPQAVRPTQVIGRVSTGASAQTGIPAGTPVVMGSGDFTCSAVGAGCLRPGQAYLNLGSSSWVATSSTHPIAHEDMAVVNNVHAVDKLFVPLGSAQEAGAGFKWLAGVTGAGQSANPYENVYPYRGVGGRLNASSPGAGGLAYLPFLLGPAAACYDQGLRGGFLGLTSAHTGDDLARAVWEGSAMYLERLLMVLTGGSPPDSILATGVASHEDEMLQTLSDVFGLPVENTELAATVDCMGAAIIAGVGAGIYPDLDQTGLFYKKRDRFTPNPDAQNVYRAGKERFEKCFEFFKTLSPTFGG